MSYQRERSIAWLLVIAGVALLFPVQNAIDTYRNTFRVSMYPTANRQQTDAVAAQMRELGLEPRVSERRDPKGQPYAYLTAVVPRKEWGRDQQRYHAAVQNLPRVSRVVPGLNEQGIPLERIQELNVQDVGIVVIAALIGGFRKSAANVLWLQNDANWESGKSYRTLPLARAVTTLDPNFVDAWTLTCWHLAYNMSVEAPTPDEAAELIRQGLEFAEQGLPWNSTRYEIYQEIGWTYYDKIQNYARAAEYFKKAIEHPHPPYLERSIAHAYERIPDIESALFWYDVSLRKYGYDPVAQGAIITINERYVRAWEEFKQGNYDAAMVKLKEDWQKDDPFDTIGMHFQARIYEAKAEEARRAGDDEQTRALYRSAFETWRDAGEHNATDRLARRRVLTIARNWGWLQDVPQGWNDVGLPDSWAQKLQPERGRERNAPSGEGEGDAHDHEAEAAPQS